MEPKKFTKDSPSTKVDKHNVFYTKDGYVDVPAVHVRAALGTSVPRHMVYLGHLVLKEVKGVDMYCPTPAGVKWLSEGCLRHIELHPEDKSKCLILPRIATINWRLKSNSSGATNV